jgi:3-phenylpropionate/trans-cinnamate dioxygenase ferredoxin reductase subunit
MTHRVLIIGAGHAAGQLVGTLKQRDFPGSVTLVGEEPWFPYQRPPLSKKFLSGELEAERLLVRPQSFYEDDAISVHRSCRIVSLDRQRAVAASEGGDEFGYDTLVLALGARPREFRVPGADLQGIHYLRTIEDVEGIRADLKPGSRLAIVGAGYIGLEVAAVAAAAGASVTVIEAEQRVLSRVVSPEVSAVYEDIHRERGVQILLSARVTAFTGGDRVQATVLDDGREIPTDFVVIGVGAVPNTELAAAAGLEVDDGIVVDEHCRTSDPLIYAAGDCTMHPNPLLARRLRLESVQNALEQARTAALNICGEPAVYSEIPWFWSDQYEFKLQIAGLQEGYDRMAVRGDPASRSFSCLYLDGDRLVAIEAVNRPQDFIHARRLITERTPLDVDKIPDPSISLKDLG